MTIREQGHPDARQPRDVAIMLSPLLVLGAGFVTSRIATPVLGGWAWIPTILVLWLLFAGLALGFLGVEGARRAFAPARGVIGWRVAAVLVGVLPISVFLAAYRHLADPVLLACWIGFAAINPLLEELYWRATLFKAADGLMPRWVAVPVFAGLFALNHSVSLGAFSIANAHPVTAIATFVLGVVWSITYLRSGSLRYPLAGHVLTDLLNLSVIVFLNLYVPALPR